MAAVIEIKYNRFPTIGKEVKQALSQHVRRTALIVEGKAEQKSRVRTGEMKGGWETRFESEMTAFVFNGVSWVIHNEFGTRKMSAQPMIRPAVEESREDFRRGIIDILNG